MNKFIKAIVVVAMLGLAFQVLASKPEAEQEDVAFERDWQAIKTTVESL